MSRMEGVTDVRVRHPNYPHGQPTLTVASAVSSPCSAGTLFTQTLWRLSNDSYACQTACFWRD